MSSPSTKGLFVKERLVEARDARSITQKHLAKLLGAGGSTISNWEHGTQTPKPGTLERLAEVLDVFPSYLLRSVPNHGSSAIFFRSLANATSRVRTREKARVRWLQHISLALQEILEFPRVNFPEIVEPEAYLRLSFADIERISFDLRDHWKLGEGPIPSMVLVAENAGAVVGLDQIGSMSIDGQGSWSEVDLRPYILLCRDKNTAFRRQMDVAHELGHLILHRNVDETKLERDFELIEEQAKYFSSAFLLPDRSFSAEIFSISLDGFLSMKNRWKVSVGAMIMRAHQLELITDEATRRLWKSRAIRRWNRREPLDLPGETPVEEPRLLRRSIEMIVSNNVRSKRELVVSDIGVGTNDIEMMTALPMGYLSDIPSIVPIEPRLKNSGEQDGAGSVVPFRR
jgi:Zn-dependent peptidase ImmA (M78 family)/DNA-binding XRE family transcriptional regulator